MVLAGHSMVRRSGGLEDVDQRLRRPEAPAFFTYLDVRRATSCIGGTMTTSIYASVARDCPARGQSRAFSDAEPLSPEHPEQQCCVKLLVYF